MISHQFSKAQIARLAGLKFFPSEAAALRELVLALESYATQDIATEIVDDFLRRLVESPAPSQVYGAVHELNSKSAVKDPMEAWGPRPNLCPDCRGFGTVGTAPDVTFCDCPDGRAVRSDPRLGERYLRIVNSMKAPGSAISNADTDRYFRTASILQVLSK